MTVIGQSNRKKLMAGGIYLLVAAIVATAFTVRGQTLLAANESASKIVAESSQVASTAPAPAEDDGAASPDAGKIDPGGLVKPALEAIRSTARKVIF